MASWAAIAKSAPAVAPEPKEDDSKDARIAVVDANAIINGLRLESIADKAITIQEVLSEIRDKQSRQFLEMLPFGLEVREPSEESMKIVTRFAKETGDIHSLSGVDMKLLALAHTLEVAAHGSDHLRQHPAPPKMAPKHKTRARALPGWGNVSNPEEWAAIDEVPDNENAGTVAGSRIAQHAQELQLESGLLQTNDAATTEQHTEQLDDDDEDDDQSDEQDDDGWEVACKTNNARRRKQRRQKRWQMRMEEEQQALAQLRISEQQQQQHQQQEEETSSSSPAPTSADPSSGQQEQQQQQQQQQQQDSEDYTDEEETDQESSDPEDSSTAQHDTDSLAGLSSAPPAFESSIASVTADFAMQNVLLQMGLRLVSRDGRVIRKLSRWALRCQACFFVTKEAGKVFCPRCGNLTLEKVEVQVGADGAELYGIKKRHVLRGTRYSLPKPKGGRMRNQPILSEDVMMQRLPHLMKPNKKKPQPSADPFAPEYGPDSWFAKQQVLSSAKAAAAILPGWKSNPNERKLTRSNRRK